MEVKSRISSNIILNLRVSDKVSFNNYLRDIWPDLVSKRIKNQNDKDLIMDNSGNIIGITKLIFNNYYSLPGIIGDRLFRVFDSKRKNILEFDVFKTGMNTLFCGNYENVIRFIFDFYDFDGDGKISKEDIRVILSYVHFSNKKNKKLDTKELYESSVKDQSKLVEILEKCFENKGELINFDDFCKIIENINNDIYILIYIFLLQNRPFSKKVIKLYQNISKEKIKNRNFDTINSNGDSNYNSSISDLNIRMTQSHIGLNLANNFSKINNTIESNIRKKKSYGNNGMVDICDNGIFHEDVNIWKTVYEKHLNKEIIKEMNKIDYNDKKKIINDLDENKNILECENNNYEGYLFKYNKDRMIKIYFKLYYKDMFFYRKENDIKHYCVHNLSGSFFSKENFTKLYEEKIYYQFSIIFPSKRHIYYYDNENEFKIFSKYLQIATKYSNLLEIYEIDNETPLGSGSFSLVKLGVHKITKEKVAVKIMDKIKMNTTRLESARTEIEIMKICQHPNIIRFIDSYEDADKIYIFMEYCEGGTLYKFLQKRSFILKEDLAVNIVHKICMAVYYFHSFGITHRDLKPENILMTSDDENPEIKILDFGLSKIIGPNELCNEPYGTVIYCAPEIILDYPYTKNVDSWSVGIITFIMLYGNLPFFNKVRSLLIKSITRDTPVYKGAYKVSEEAKNFVQRLLIKDQYKRMNIKEALEHKWFHKYNKEFVDCRIKNKDKKNVFELYTSVNMTTKASTIAYD